VGKTCGTCGGQQIRALESNWRLKCGLEVAWIDVAWYRVKGRAVVSRVINCGVL